MSVQQQIQVRQPNKSPWRPCPIGPHRVGFTLVELLVVIAIIGVLVALLLPAIQAAREAARRSSCGNNFKQLGLALQNYHDARKTFPYSEVQSAAAPALTYGYQGPTWVVAVLPFIEGSNVLTLYNKNAFWMDAAANISFRSSNLPFMICPSDSYAGTQFNGTNVGITGTVVGPQSNWARGCYGANVSPFWTSYQLAGSQAAWAQWTTNINGKGIMAPNYALSMKQITDGTSKVIALVEMRADPDAAGARGVWALGTGSSAAWAHGGTNNNSSFPDPGPNFAGNPLGQPGSGDVTLGCGTNVTAAQAFAVGMGCYGNGANDVMGPKSQHPGGLLTVFCDGSVHWIDDSIQVGAVGQSASSIINGFWEMLFLSQDGANVPQDVYNNN